MKKFLPLLALLAILVGCSAPKGEKCQEEGEGHNERYVCVKN